MNIMHSQIWHQGFNFSEDKKKGEQEVTPTLPEVKEHAAKAIARAAKNGKLGFDNMAILVLKHQNGVSMCTHNVYCK